MSSVDLTNELRLAKPRAPEQLRERVLALSERPVREPRFSFSLPSRYTVRRVALVAAPAVVAVAARRRRDPRDRRTRARPNQQAAASRPTSRPTTRPSCACARQIPGVTGALARSAATEAGLPRRSLRGASAEREPAPALPGVAHRPRRRPRRAVAVDPGGDAHRPRARRLRRVAPSSTPAKQGNSALVVSIPIGHVQHAIAKFSALGTIAAQNIQITDLQAQFNRLVKRIGALRVAIAKVDDRLADTSLSNEERVRLEQQRARLAARLEALRTSRAHTARRAALATVSLGLTTQEAAAVAKPEHRGPLGRALHDAGNILRRRPRGRLYALIVLGPILLDRAARVAAGSRRPSPVRPPPA